MNEKILANRSILTKEYFINHDLLEPSRSNDYDYDPDHPERRFYTTLLHKLSFKDSVMKTDIVEIEFTSEAIKSILETIQRAKHEVCLASMIIDDPSIRLSNQIEHCILAISSIPGKINIDILCNSNNTKITIDIQDVSRFEWLLNVEDDFSGE